VPSRGERLERRKREIGRAEEDDAHRAPIVAALHSRIESAIIGEGGGRRRAFLRELFILATFLVATLVMTWPWAAHLRDHAKDAVDSYHQAWILWWDFHQTFHDPLHLYDSNLFFPHRQTLAFSENDYGIALPLFPLHALSLPPLTVHGIAVLLGFALSGYGAFRLARTLTGSPAPAALAGLAFAFVPYRFAQLNHVHYLSSGWIALAVEAAVLFGLSATRARAAWLAVAVLMCGLSTMTWLLFSALSIGAASLLAAARSGTLREPRFWLRAAAALGTAGLALALFTRPYAEVTRRYRITRSREEVEAFSGTPRSWIQVYEENRFWHAFANPDVNQDRALSPGLILLAAPLAALSLAFTRRKPDALAAAVGTACLVPGFIGSLGLHTPFYRLLYEWVPAVRAVRVPMRFAMVGILGLALLLAASVARFDQGRGRVLAPALAALFLVEARCFPLKLVRGPAAADDLARFLKRAPMRGGIAELPDSVEALALYDLRAADHGRPLITAYSSFEPADTARLHELARKRPIPKELLDRLEEVPASYLVLHESLFSTEDRGAAHVFAADALASGRLRFVRRFEGPPSDLYALARIEPAATSAGDPPWLAGEKRLGLGAKEDPSLLGSIDHPKPGADVHGPLTVGGWARIAGEDLAVTVLVDGVAAPVLSSRRTPRPDVGAVFPALAPSPDAGYEVVLAPPAPGEPAREVTVQVVFSSRDGRVRHCPAVAVRWAP
jgi:hypothetical protein